MLRILASLLLCLVLLPAESLAKPARDAAPQWMHVNGVHFSLLTDALPKKGVEVELRFEQIRAVIGQLLLKSKLRLSEPLSIIAFASHAEYMQAAPAPKGPSTAATGVFLPGADRNYVILDLSDDESWRAISYPLAKVFLFYNYPPTDEWFDEGFGEYVSSLGLETRPAQIGGDPASFVSLLKTQPWIPIPELFARKSSDSSPAPQLFRAESWVVMHYLLSQNKLPETGTYFGLVKIQKAAVAQAIQQAYGMDAAQFEKAIKDYFNAIAPALQAATSPAGAGNNPIQALPALLGPGDIGSSVLKVTESEARALVAEASLRVPEHRGAAESELNTLVSSTQTETAVAHRALAWDLLQKKNYDESAEELAKASDLDQHDFWVRYYLALLKYQRATAEGGDLQGLPNMMQDLRAVIDLDVDFAEAYNMLALAQMQGGGNNAALSTIRSAIELNPRSQTYLLNLSHIYLAGKKWDAASALLERLKDNSDQQVAATARKDLADLPTLKKYGILPQRGADARPPVAVSSTPDEPDEPPASATPAEAGPDMRKPQSLKGKLLNVDCSQPPAALVRVAAGGKVLKLRTEDYKSLLLIGSDNFSCEWRNMPVIVNFKAGGKADGDLVSLEAQ